MLSEQEIFRFIIALKNGIYKRRALVSSTDCITKDVYRAVKKDRKISFFTGYNSDIKITVSNKCVSIDDELFANKDDLYDYVLKNDLCYEDVLIHNYTYTFIKTLIDTNDKKGMLDLIKNISTPDLFRYLINNNGRIVGYNLNEILIDKYINLRLPFVVYIPIKATTVKVVIRFEDKMSFYGYGNIILNDAELKNYKLMELMDLT